MKLITPVEIATCPFKVSLSSKILLLGSCFADNIGAKMSQCGFNVKVNPFGTLYNPISVCNSVARLSSARSFTEQECVQMGAGADMICSFSHHTAAARQDIDTFLTDANQQLSESSSFFADADIVIITLGTSWIFRHIESNMVVSNCLKRPAFEFERECLTLGKVTAVLDYLVKEYGSGKKFLFTVSPVRHLKDTAHGNQLSKSILLMATDEICNKYSDSCAYFPSYEIMNDELRDYRFYAEDMVHPSSLAIDYIWERFCDFAVPNNEIPMLLANRKKYLRSQHRTILK